VPEVDRSRCLLCGSYEKNCPAGALSVKGEEWTVSQLMEELKKDEVFYQSSGGGITFSGGEPLLQPEFLVKTAAACRSRGYHTALETAAFASEEVMEQVMPYIDLFLCDLKLIDEKDHQMKTGVSNRMILRNLLRLREAGKQVILRIPVIPGYTDGDENLMGIGDFAAKEGFTEIHLLPYHNYGEAKYKQLGRIYALEGIPPMKQEDLEKVKNQMEKNFGLHVKIGG